jgi:3-hydroxyacyl-CoA dehydrogenase
LRKLRDDDSKLAAAKADISIFTNAVAALTKKARGLEAPFAPRMPFAPRSSCRSTKG